MTADTSIDSPNATGPAGGKAAGLMRLREAGFTVPDFDHVSPEDEPEIAAIEAVKRLGFPLAVRSSASVEDHADHSFAGQFRSFLNLETVPDVVRAIRDCRATSNAPAVADYCRRNRLDPARIRMGVLIQRMVQPDLAGVAFTVNPLTGDHGVVIEAIDGLADKLLGGRQKPLPADHPLLARYEARIGRVARKVHRHFGAPQDIEFAVADDTVFILQSRPITRIHFQPGIGEWTTADFRDGGVSSGVCAPLMWSLYESVWQEALPGFLREIGLLDGDFTAGRMFFGRPYWNVGAVKYRLGLLPGFDERKFERDLGIVRPPNDPHRPPPDRSGRPSVSVSSLFRLGRVALSMRSVWKGQREVNTRLLHGGFESLVRPYQVAIADCDRFRSLIENVHRIVETNYFRTIFCVSLARMDFLESFPEADRELNVLTSALPELEHLAPARMIREMADRGETDITPLLRRFGHRGRRELDLLAPRWDEDPDWVRGLLEKPVAGGGKDPRPVYERTRERVRSIVGWHRRKRFDRKLDRLRDFLWMREQMRDLSSRTYHLVRKYALRIGKRERLNDDVFFMTWREILRGDRSGIATNREIYECYRNFEAPTEIGAGQNLSGPIHGELDLRGIGASPGQIRAPAWTATRIEEALLAPEGSVLICPFTDPGWTPVLGRVGGVVTEAGGFLSHAAVICREFGVPAVLNVRGAVRRIRSGTDVFVDGTNGIVRIESEARASIPKPPAAR